MHINYKNHFILFKRISINKVIVINTQNIIDIKILKFLKILEIKRISRSNVTKIKIIIINWTEKEFCTLLFKELNPASIGFNEFLKQYLMTRICNNINNIITT